MLTQRVKGRSVKLPRRDINRKTMMAFVDPGMRATGAALRCVAPRYSNFSLEDRTTTQIVAEANRSQSSHSDALKETD